MSKLTNSQFKRIALEQFKEKRVDLPRWYTEYCEPAFFEIEILFIQQNLYNCLRIPTKTAKEKSDYVRRLYLLFYAEKDLPS